MIVLLAIYCVVEVAQSDGDDVRFAPKWLWLAAVVLMPLVGSVAWLVWGRPTRSTPGEWPQYSKKQPKGPDDDDSFLRSL